MTIDQRTRMDKEVRALSRDEVFDGVIADKAGSTGSWAKAGSGRLILGIARSMALLMALRQQSSG